MQLRGRKPTNRLHRKFPRARNLRRLPDTRCRAWCDFRRFFRNFCHRHGLFFYCYHFRNSQLRARFTCCLHFFQKHISRNKRNKIGPFLLRRTAWNGPKGSTRFHAVETLKNIEQRVLRRNDLHILPHRNTAPDPVQRTAHQRNFDLLVRNPYVASHLLLLGRKAEEIRIRFIPRQFL